jgi:hypothetical protein
MALSKCPECGGLVSSTASACPHCGNRAFSFLTGNQFKVNCRYCKGKGSTTNLYEETRRCYQCLGTGCVLVGEWRDSRDGSSRLEEQKHKSNEEMFFEEALMKKGVPRD